MTINNMPLVSVIVTTYNRKKLLKETINSILDQTYQNFELIVVDNYSNYDFLSHIKTFDDNRINAYQNANDGIIAVNRNVGIKKAKGEYIAFCDDDDLWLPLKLEKQIKIIKDNNLKGVGSLMLRFNGNKIYGNKNSYRKYVDYFNFDDVLKKNMSVPLSSLLIKNDGNLFDENYKLTNVEDWDFQIRLLKDGGFIGKINQPLIKYRVSDLGYTEKKLNSIYLLSNYKNYFTEVEYNKSLSRYYKMIGFGYMLNGNKKEAINFLSLVNYTSHDSTIYVSSLLKIMPNFIFIIIYQFYFILRKIYKLNIK